jgi:anti-sigma-K factor RskA
VAVPRRIFWVIALTAAVAAVAVAYVVFRLLALVRPSDRANARLVAAAPRRRRPRVATEAVAMLASEMERGVPPVVQYHSESGEAAAGGPAHERFLELRRERRPSAGTLVALAVVSGLTAIALGSWAFIRTERDNGSVPATRVTRTPVEQAVSLLAKPSTRRIPLAGSVGRIVLVVGPRNNGVLVLDGLGRAPVGRAYQAWVIKPKAKAPTSAALFTGGEVVVPLITRVPKGSTVAVTLEPSGGSPSPTKTPKIASQRS